MPDTTTVPEPTEPTTVPDPTDPTTVPDPTDPTTVPEDEPTTTVWHHDGHTPDPTPEPTPNPTPSPVWQHDGHTNPPTKWEHDGHGDHVHDHGSGCTTPAGGDCSASRCCATAGYTCDPFSYGQYYCVMPAWHDVITLPGLGQTCNYPQDCAGDLVCAPSPGHGGGQYECMSPTVVWQPDGHDHHEQTPNPTKVRVIFRTAVLYNEHIMVPIILAIL